MCMDRDIVFAPHLDTSRELLVYVLTFLSLFFCHSFIPDIRFRRRWIHQVRYCVCAGVCVHLLVHMSFPFATEAAVLCLVVTAVAELAFDHIFNNVSNAQSEISNGRDHNCSRVLCISSHYII